MSKTLTIRTAVALTAMLGVMLFINPGTVDADTATDSTSTASSALCVAPKPVDNRAERLDTYFADRDMPLAGYGKELVDAADGCGLDWRLVAAIGVRESSGGKHLMNNNPFGWGSAKIPFKNFSQAITEVTNNLCGNDPDTAKYYKGKTVPQILYFYNGSVLPEYTGQVMAIMDRF